MRAAGPARWRWRCSASDVVWSAVSMDQSFGLLAIGQRVTARALLVGDRIDQAGLERSDALSANPLAFRAGANGVATLFRYGVAVLIGLTPLEEDEVVRGLKPRIRGELARH